jgi:hypothetical protein
VATQHEPQVAAEETQRVHPAALGGLHRVDAEQLRAVFEHTVAVESERHEDEVALAVGVKAAKHVGEHAQARLAQAPVLRQTAVGVDRPRDPCRGGERDLALGHAPVQLVLRVAAHEMRALRADQLPQPPHAHPLANGVRQGRALGGEGRRDDLEFIRK